ncbi:DUF4352 domain-containing protein [Chloroflexota bacterium]
MSILLLFALLSSLACESLLTPSSGVTSQIAQIQGNVIAVTDTIFTSGDKYFNSPKGVVYWIVNVSVTSHRYENPITANPGHWKLNIDGKLYDAHGSFPDAQSTIPMEIPQGKSGTTTIRFAVPDSASVVGAKLLYIGQSPESSGSLSGGKRVDAYDWKEQKLYTYLTLSGTYIATIFGWEESATFREDTLELYNRLDGKRIFKYKISQDERSISLTNVVSGQKTVMGFKYGKEPGFVVIGEATYYRQ